MREDKFQIGDHVIIRCKEHEKGRYSHIFDGSTGTVVRRGWEESHHQPVYVVELEDIVTNDDLDIKSSDNRYGVLEQDLDMWVDPPDNSAEFNCVFE